jgi:hypothetical protein
MDMAMDYSGIDGKRFKKGSLAAFFNVCKNVALSIA